MKLQEDLRSATANEYACIGGEYLLNIILDLDLVLSPTVLPLAFSKWRNNFSSIVSLCNTQGPTQAIKET
jgi:hypothetical protein